MIDLAARSATAELELSAKGVDPLLAQDAVRHARRWAIGTARLVSPDIRDRVASDLFEAQLQRVEEGYVRGRRESKPPDESTRRYVEGLERAGVTVGPETRKRYEAEARRVAR